MRIELNDSHFQILEVTRLSRKDEIKKAFSDKIKKWHPDKFHGSSEKIFHAHEMSKKIIEQLELLENYNPPANFNSHSTHKSYSKKQTTLSSSRPTSPSKTTRLTIIRTKVKSSNIRSVGYDTLLKVLQVEFLNGSFCQYYDVPEHIFTELLKDDSKGKFFNSKNIILLSV